MGINFYIILRGNYGRLYLLVNGPQGMGCKK